MDSEPASEQVTGGARGWPRVPANCTGRGPSHTGVGFPGGSACNAGALGSIPGLGRPPGEGNWLPTPVSWPGEFPELDSPWGGKESGHD